MASNTPASFNKRFLKATFAIVVTFFFFILLEVALKVFFPFLPMNAYVVFAGNTILLMATLLSLFFYIKSIEQEKPFALVKFVYLAMFSKLAVCLLPAVVYILWAGENVNKPALVFCACMYIVYSYSEVSILLKQNKRRSNAQAGSTA